MKTKLLILTIGLLSLVAMVSATTTQTIIMAGAVTTKPLLGLLISLGIENFVSAVDAVYLYNLIAVAIILVGAAMSGARSEAAFCILVPIMAGVLEWFGWLRMTNATTHLPSQTGQAGLMAMTIVAGLIGLLIYMKAQNRDAYGSYGSGSLLFTVITFIALFNISLGIVTGFSTFPIGATSPHSTQCAVGFSCDSQGNFDFKTTMAGVGSSASVGHDIYSGLGMFAEQISAMVLIMFGLFASLVTAPFFIANVIGGVWPWLITDPTTGSPTAIYLAFTSFISVALIFIYIYGAWEFFTNRPGSTL